MHRHDILNMPAYAESFAQRLIKLNQIDYNTWRQGAVAKIYEQVEALDDLDRHEKETREKKEKTQALEVKPSLKKKGPHP